MTRFEQLVKERRSARNFHPEHKITKEELDSMFELVKFGPSAYNLQHTNYIVVTDPEIKKQLKVAANHQHKVETASAVIIVLGDKEAYKKAADINKGLLMLGVYTEQEFDYIVNDIISMYETRGPEFQRDKEIRNASLSAMLFMLVAKDKGWDTCPMIGFNPERVRDILNISEQYKIVLMITLGKEKVESRHPRGYRKPVNEFVTFI